MLDFMPLAGVAVLLAVAMVGAALGFVLALVSMPFSRQRGADQAKRFLWYAVEGAAGTLILLIFLTWTGRR